MKPLLLLCLLSAAAFAYDSDPGYGPRTDYTPGARRPGQKAQIYYKPTMRYFGKGYTVTYRYVQLAPGQSRPALTEFDSQQYYLSATAIKTVIGTSPRVTYYAPNAAPTTAPVTRTAGGAKEVPPIAEQIRK